MFSIDSIQKANLDIDIRGDDYRSTHMGFQFKGRNSNLSTHYQSKTTHSHYQKPVKLDYSSGDPFYNIKKDQKESYVREFGTGKQMNEVIQNLNQFPRLKEKIHSQLIDFQNTSRQQAGSDGAQGSFRSRMYLREHKQKQMRKEEELLEKIIKNEPYACKGNNLKVILTKQWTEEAKAYKLYSQIDSKDEARIKDLIS